MKVPCFQGFGFNCQPAPLHLGLSITAAGALAWGRATAKQRGGARVTALEISPVLDVVAVGFSNGHVVIVNVLMDKVVMDLPHDGSRRAVRAMAFRSGESDDPVLVIGGDSGVVSAYDLNKRHLRTLLSSAHDGPVHSIHFFPG